ncbi:MAG TPA: hypothetical protein VLX89_10735 [Actinomycetota bacterium]|nr:hypothetical protein [Actinomycetota bacterium]
MRYELASQSVCVSGDTIAYELLDPVSAAYGPPIEARCTDGGDVEHLIPETTEAAAEGQPALSIRATRHHPRRRIRALNAATSNT